MDFEQILKEIKQDRSRLTEVLLNFVQTDTILFAFDEECQSCFNAKILQVNEILNTAFRSSLFLDVLPCNVVQKDKVCSYLNTLSYGMFMLLYLVATEVRSVLLGVLFIEKKIAIEEILNTSFYEELYEQEKWGEAENLATKYEAVKGVLQELEIYRDENVLFEN